MSTLKAMAGSAAASDTSEHLDRAFFGHPKGLGYLAFTEAWEESVPSRSLSLSQFAAMMWA